MEKNNKKKIDPKLNKFIDYIVAGKTQVEARELAGYDTSNKEKNHKLASRLFNSLPAQRIYRQKLDNLVSKTTVTQEKVLNEIANLAFANITDIVTWENEKVKVKDSNDLSETAKRSIKKIKIRTYHNEFGSDTQIDIELHDKMQPLQKLGEYLQMWQKQDIHNTINVTQFLQKVQQQYQLNAPRTEKNMNATLCDNIEKTHSEEI